MIIFIDPEEKTVSATWEGATRHESFSTPLDFAEWVAQDYPVIAHAETIPSGWRYDGAGCYEWVAPVWWDK